MPADSNSVSILHFADLHIKDDKRVIKHMEKAAEAIISTLESERPDLVVIAGDYFHKNFQFDSEGARFAVSFFKELSQHAPILMLEGTETHDRKSLDTLASVQVLNPVKIVTEPSIVHFDEIPALAGCDFYCMPGIKKRNFQGIAEEYGLDILKAQPGELAAYQFQRWAEEQFHRPARDVIFVGHIQLGVEGLEKMQTGYEPVISPSTIEFIKPSLGLLGHVHDLISHGKYHYSGDIVPDNMIEAEVVSIEADGRVNIDRPAPKKGFYIHTRVPGEGWESAFHPVETVKFCKVLIKAQDEADLAAKMETAQGLLKTRGEGLGEDSLVCKFDVETPDPAVSDAVFRHENTIRTSMGSVAEVVSPTINVTTFSQHAARVEDKADWQKKDTIAKFHEWRTRRGFASDETEERELDEKIRQVL